MIHKEIIYFGKKTFLACDEKCNKAWGINSRPEVYLQCTTPDVIFKTKENRYPKEFIEGGNVDDSAWLSDNELGEAPIDPGTYEGNDGKPTEDSEKLNKWCCRECERSVMCNTLEEAQAEALKKSQEFQSRVYNIPREN